MVGGGEGVEEACVVFKVEVSRLKGGDARGSDPKSKFTSISESSFIL